MRKMILIPNVSSSINSPITGLSAVIKECKSRDTPITAIIIPVIFLKLQLHSQLPPV